jgi:DNA polymerase III subunit gamma/tau
MSAAAYIVGGVSSLALYRRYRPETFAEVIGQEHVTEPLQQALRNNRVNHAYLFSGPRGCGKTTSARILARCLNCEQGPTPTPCGECRSCIDLARNGPGSIDVIEIDAASHGGVDDARDLREKAFFGPASSRYKIYIIDEAHMVTPAGFNALLKVVEEPPEHLKFIFATTEPEKVIGTIRSRTHHYPFRLVAPGTLRDYLAQVCEREAIPVDDAVLPLAVRAGAGSVRDSMSVMDQLLAGAAEDGVTYAMATALLGYTDSALLDAVVEAFATGDGAATFEVVDRVIEGGHDPRRFVADLLERLRDLVIIAAVPDALEKGLIAAPGDVVERMQAQASTFGPAELSRAADLVNAGLTEMRGATSPRLQLELICARVLLPAAYGDERSLQARLDRLERGAAAGGLGAAAAGAPPSVPAPGDGLSGQAAARAALGARGGAQPPAPPQPPAQPEPSAAAAPPAAAAPAPAGPPDGGPSAEPALQHGTAGAEPPGRRPGAWPGGTDTGGVAGAGGAAAAERRPGAWPTAATPGSGAPSAASAPPVAPAPPSPQPAGPTGPAEPAGQVGPDGWPVGAQPGSGRPAAAAAPAAAAPQAAAAGPGGAEQVRRLWPDILEAVKNRRRFTWILLSQNAQVVGFDGTTLQVGFATSGARDSFVNGGSLEVLQQALTEAIGVQWKLEAVVDPSGGGGGGGGVAGGPAGQGRGGPGPRSGGPQAPPPPPPDAGGGPASPPAGGAPPGDGPPGGSVQGAQGVQGAPGGQGPHGARQAMAAVQTARVPAPAGPPPPEPDPFADDTPADDDPDLEDSALSGYDLIVRELGATVLEEFHHE